MNYTIVNKLPRNSVGAVWWHIKVGYKFYIVSANVVPYSGPEVMVFPADEDGKVTDFGEIVSIRDSLDHKECIAELLEVLSESDEEEEAEASNTISEHDAINGFDDYLNEMYPDNVMVCGHEFTPARALKELDPTAYREMFNNWLDSEGLELE